MGYSSETEVEEFEGEYDDLDSSETEVEEFENEYDDSEGIFETAWSPFRSIPYQGFASLPSFSFPDDDFESAWEEAGWRRTPRISKKAVDAMPMVKIDQPINCPICLEEFAIGEEAKEMQCKHKFHRECIVPWLETHCSCPLCRFEMTADDAEDSDDESDGADGDRVEVDEDSGRRETRRNVRFAFVPSLWSRGYGNSYWNESDGGADDDGRVEDDDDDDDDDYRFGFFPSPWSRAYGNSYWNGSDGGAGEDNDNDSVGGDDGISNWRSYLCRHHSLFRRSNGSFYRMSDNDGVGGDDGISNRRSYLRRHHSLFRRINESFYRMSDHDGVGGDDGIRNRRQGLRPYSRRHISLLHRSDKSFYPMRIPFSPTLRGEFSVDATKGFSRRISTSVLQGMHSNKFGGLPELDEYNTTAMRSKVEMKHATNLICTKKELGQSIWRDGR